MSKLILFDFDGVLANTLDEILRNSEEACKRLAHNCKPKKEDVDALERMEFEELGRQLGIPDFKIKDFVKIVLELFASREGPLKIFPNIDKAIKMLSKVNKIGIITGNNSQVVQNFLNYHKLNDHIDIILDISQPGSKSDKIVKATELLHFSRSDVYMVGDAVSDIHAAEEARVKSIAVTWGNQSSIKLKKTNPDFIVHSPEELIQVLCD